MFTDEDIRYINNMYWVEEDEMELGIHPSQVKERIQDELNNIEREYEEITYLDYIQNNKVKVYLDGEYFATFDYIKNYFE